MFNKLRLRFLWYWGDWVWERRMENFRRRKLRLLVYKKCLRKLELELEEEEDWLMGEVG